MSGKPVGSPAVQTAKDISRRNGDERILVLASGDHVRLRPVSASLIDEVTSRVPEPEIPVWHNPDKGRDEPNPSDPRYLAALEEMNRKRGLAAMDAMVMFGVELVDGLPQDDSWLKKLRMMERRGMLDLSAYDLDDPLDMEFLYKRFIAVDASVLSKISEVSGVSGAEVARAERSFPGDESR